jgi:hypothetical protein
VDSIPADNTRTELFAGATKGPLSIFNLQDEDGNPFTPETFGAWQSKMFRNSQEFSGSDQCIAVMVGNTQDESCEDLIFALVGNGRDRVPNALLLAAAPRLLRERDTLLARLEGRGELPENYRIVPSGMIHGEIGLIELRGDEVSAGWPDTPASRRILTAMAWAHWHTSEVGK